MSLPGGRRSRNLTQLESVQVRMRGLGLAGGLALVLAGCPTAGCGPGTARTSAVARPHAAADGWRVVSYHGVHVQAPAAWPVVDGMHAGSCGSPFPAAPTVFIGPDDNPPGVPAGKIIPADRCKEPAVSVKGQVIDLWYSGKAQRR